MTLGQMLSTIAVVAAAGAACSGHYLGALCLLALWALVSGVANGELRGGKW